jgi:hypothetical protein
VNQKSNVVAIGLRAKTARAIVVVLGGSGDTPIVLKKFEMTLADPKVPATAQPYHEVMDLSWEESQKAVRKSARAIEAIARRALSKLIKELQSAGMNVSGVGIVGAQDKDLARIGNFHIRAHAAEGVLFRRVLDLAADANSLTRQTFPDRDFDGLTRIELGAQSGIFKKMINDLGRKIDPPCRTDEKQAATAAWLVLHRRRK